MTKIYSNKANFSNINYIGGTPIHEAYTVFTIVMNVAFLYFPIRFVVHIHYAVESISKKRINRQGKSEEGIPRRANRIAHRTVLSTQISWPCFLSETDVASIMWTKQSQVWATSVRRRIHYAKAFITRITRNTMFLTFSSWFVLVCFRLFFIFQVG